mgnify:CR=1 FL=1
MKLHDYDKRVIKLALLLFAFCLTVYFVTKDVLWTVIAFFTPFVPIILIQDFFTAQNIKSSTVSFDSNYFYKKTLKEDVKIKISEIKEIKMENGIGRIVSNEEYSGVFWPPLQNPFTAQPSVFFYLKNGGYVSIGFQLLQKEDVLQNIREFLNAYPNIAQDKYAQQLAKEGLTWMLAAKFTFK